MLNTFFLLHRLTYRVLCQEKLWKTSFFRKCLRIDQETLQLSLFASMFLSLVKKTFCKEDTFLLLYCPMCRALYEREFEPPNSQSMSKEKSRNIANIGIQSYITKFIQKCFILSVYCTTLCTERFEPPHSLSTSKKKLGHTKNINIWSYNRKFSEKTVL